MSLSFLIARRFRRSREKSGYLSFISASSSVGIALGCAILIILLSVMNGFHRALEQDLLSLVPQVEFKAVHGALNDWEALAAHADAHPQVMGSAPVIPFTAMIQQRQRFHGVQVRAIDAEREHRVSRLSEFVNPDRWQQFVEQPDGILLGRGLLDRLQLAPGDTVVLLVPQMEGSSTRASPRRVPVTIVGAFEFGGELDYQQAYMHLNLGREAVGIADGATTVRLRLDDVYQAPRVAAEVSRGVAEYAYIHDWTRTEGHLYRDIELVRTVMYIVLVLVLAVASFNIVATLMMQVEEKRAAIAILKTMGASDRTILRAFVWQGALSGIPGALVGAALGCLGAWALPDLLTLLEQVTGRALLADDIYFVSVVPVHILWQDVVLVTGVAMLMSVLATVFPAKRAAQLPPAESLRQA
ncbi:MAG: lipoprotein-releasing ABC transporter permease subunit [Idiomarina sp.]|nr:lipoprotein-releasing ABC transporter permease subunit [Idiomarina sp.]